MRPSLESLLAASSHMLKEVLDSPFVDPLKNLRLPRELNPNKKYSWMQKKEERVRPSGPISSCLWGRGGGGSRGRVPLQRRHLAWVWLALESKGLICIQLPLPTYCVVPGKSFPLPGPQFIQLLRCQEQVPRGAAWWTGKSRPGRAPCCLWALGEWPLL